MTTPEVLYRCPNCLRAEPGLASCCGAPRTIPSLAPVLPDIVYGHVVQGRTHQNQVASELLRRACAGHSPQRAADAAVSFAACRARHDHCVWLWQSDLDTLLRAGESENERVLFALAQTAGLILELTALPEGGVAELQDQFEQLSSLVARVGASGDPRLAHLVLVCHDVLQDAHVRFDARKYGLAIAYEINECPDVRTALELVISRAPTPAALSTRREASTHVRLLGLDTQLHRELLFTLHAQAGARGNVSLPFVAEVGNAGSALAGSVRRPVFSREDPIPAWRGFRGTFGRRQTVTFEIASRDWLFQDDAAPLVVCLGARSTESERLLHLLLLRLVRFRLAPTVFVSTSSTAPELVTWCHAAFPGARWVQAGAEPPLQALTAALSEIPLPPLLDVTVTQHWLARFWPFRRRTAAA